MNRNVTIILFVAFLAGAQRQRRPSSTTTEMVITRLAYGPYPPDTRGSDRYKDGKTKFVFEGVDYDLMPPELYKKNHDCRTDFLTCVRSHTIISPVCGWNSNTFYFHDYHSPCEIELINCRFRDIERGWGLYGMSYADNIIYYNGEGKSCKQYVRMGGHMMEAYFGNFTRRNGNFINIYKAIRHLPYRFDETKV